MPYKMCTVLILDMVKGPEGDKKKTKECLVPWPINAAIHPMQVCGLLIHQYLQRKFFLHEYVKPSGRAILLNYILCHITMQQN